MNKYKDIGSKKGGLKAKLAAIELKISLLRVVMLGCLGAFLLIWAFFIGILVGRGDHPEEVVPEIAAWMPSQNSTAPVGMDENGENIRFPDKIIPPEELEFMGNLKTRPSSDDLTRAPLATNIPPKQEKPVPQQPVVEVHQADQKPTQTAGQTKPTEKPQTQSQPKTQDSGEGVFDYVYQVAASGDKAGAENLKNKLATNGMNAFIITADKDGSVIYRINVRFRGTPDDTHQLTKQLAAAGLDRKILITKTPAQ